MHAAAAVGDPCRQRRIAHRLAGGDVLGDPAGDLLPAGGLPGLERTHLPAVAPADREIDFARGVGDVGQVIGGVVEQVAEAGPQELRLRVSGRAQLAELLGRVLDREDRGDLVRRLLLGRAEVLAGHVEHLDVLADLLVEAAAGLLAQRALVDQALQPHRRLEVLVPRVVGQGVGHGLDHVRHGVQADHVGGAVGGALGATQRRTGQRIDGVEAELELVGVVHRRQHREHADAVADEVRGVLGDHHALADGGGEEGLEALDHVRVGEAGRDQLDQVHVARRVEEMHAGEAVAHFLRQRLGQAVDRQAGGVGGQHGGGGDVRRDLLVQIELPVHPLGDRLDHQVDVLEMIQMLVVVGRDDRGGERLVGQRGRRQLGQVGDGLERDAALRAFLGGQVEQHGFDAGVGQVRSDLRAHDAGAQHGGLADAERGWVTLMQRSLASPMVRSRKRTGTMSGAGRCRPVTG